MAGLATERPAGRLVSVNVGLPRDVSWRGETVHTGIWKQSVQGRRLVRRLNIVDDGQGDLAGHGGEHRAVMVYQTDSYRYWEAHLGRGDFTFGQFGENFTVDGLPDDEVCIGDRYRIGGALFEVTQPRVTCYRVGIRMDEPAMAALLVSHHRPGFYLRVLEEGDAGAGDEIVKVADGPERVTVANLDALLYLPGHPRQQLESSLRIPALSAGWKDSLRALLDGGAPEAGNPGLTPSAGPPPAWPGFRSLRVARVDRESASVISLSFEPVDGSALPAALPGQFLVLKLRIKPDGPPLAMSPSSWPAPASARHPCSRCFIRWRRSPPAPSARIPAHLPPGTPGAGPQVSFTRSGLAAPWSSSYRSLLEFAEACDIPVKWSCRTGVCHTCECALIGGTVDYQPAPLEPPATGNLLICCSQPGSDVEIDL